MILATTKLWHYWIGFALVFASILTVIALIAGYVVKVKLPQYPKRNQLQ